MQTPSSDAKWILGAIGGAVAIIITCAGALSMQINRESGALRAEFSAQIGAVRTEVAALRDVVAEMRTDMRRMDDRLRAVEIETGKVVQRLAILERIMLPTPAPEPDADQ